MPIMERLLIPTQASVGKNASMVKQTGSCFVGTDNGFFNNNLDQQPTRKRVPIEEIHSEHILFPSRTEVVNLQSMA